MAPLDPVIMVKIGHRDTPTSLLTLQQKSEYRENQGGCERGSHRPSRDKEAASLAITDGTYYKDILER